MSRKHDPSDIRIFARFLSLLITAVLLCGLSIPVCAEEQDGIIPDMAETEISEEPEKELESADDAMAENEPLGLTDVPKPLADSREDVNYIIVEKTFSSLPAELIPDGFRVTVSSDSGGKYILNKDNALTRTTDEDGNTVWSWKISGVGTGTYTVIEEGEEVENHTVEKIGEGTAVVETAEMTVTVPVHETTCSHTNWSVKTDGDSNVLFAATLTQGGVAVISKSPLSASQRAAVSRAVLKINGPWKNPVYFYSIEEQLRNGSGFELNGATITYNASTEEVIIGKTRNWQHVATLQYSISEASNPEITINNIYKRSAADVTVRKTVVGSMADMYKEFDFTVSVSADGSDASFSMNGTTYTGSVSFSLKNGESVLLEDVPIGAQLVVSEADYAVLLYETSYTVDGGEAISGNTAAVSSVTENGHLITFTNQKDVIPDTGVFLDTMPFYLILGIVTTGAFTVFLRHLRKRNDL